MSNIRARLFGLHNRGIKHKNEPVGKVFIMESARRLGKRFKKRGR